MPIDKYWPHRDPVDVDVGKAALCVELRAPINVGRPRFHILGEHLARDGPGLRTNGGEEHEAARARPCGGTGEADCRLGVDGP
jgi:hypothetical protein